MARRGARPGPLRQGGEWRTTAKPPFERRAAATALGGRLYITGGLTPTGGISKNGNGLAACGTDTVLYLSGMDGKVYRLIEAKDG